jgi:hypothetical protein
MTPESLRRIAGVLHDLGVSADASDAQRRRQVLRRVLPVTGRPGGARPEPGPATGLAAAGGLGAALLADIGAIARESPTDPLDDRDRYRWEAMRKMALARHGAAFPARRPKPASAAVLCRLDGEAFVAESFAGILGRPPEPVALRHYADRLRDGDSKPGILREIASSAEGRWKRVYVSGLWQTTRIFRRRVLLPAPLAWTARLLSRRRYRGG